MPEEVAFATGPAIALDRIGRALADGVPPGVVATDAGYGDDTDVRDGITAQPLAAGPLASRFAAARVRPAHGDFRLSGPRAEEWLLAEWPEG